MASEIFMRRHLNSLMPVDAYGLDALQKLPSGDKDRSLLKAVITVPRNAKHSRKFHALLGVVFPHQDTYPTRDSFLAAVKMALGYADSVKLDKGRTIIVPNSISFGKMDQAEFDEFYEKALDLIQTRILPNINREDVEREVNEVLAGREAA